MPRIAPIQTSFAGGELSPRLRGRVDADLYRAALAECRNWEVTPQGSLRTWGGTRFVADLGDDPRVRALTMRMGEGQDFLVVLKHESLALYSLAGALAVQTGVNALSHIQNGAFTAGDQNWTKSEPSNSYVSSKVTFQGGDVSLYAISRGTDQKKPMITQQFTPAVTVVATLRMKVKSKKGQLDETTVRVRRVSDNVAVASFYGKPAAGSEVVLSVPLQAGVTYELRISQKASYVYSADPIVLSGTLVIDSVSLTSPATGVEVTSELVAPWSAEQLAQVRVAAEPGKNRMFFVHPNVVPWFLAYDASTQAWTFQACAFDGQPAEWTGTNWPSVAEVYQGRLWLAATPAEGHTIWASRSGDPFDFTASETIEGTPNVLASHAIVAPLATKGRIHWMQGRQMLLVGTDVGEYSVRSQSGVLAPSDHHVLEESAFGSAAAASIDLGNQVLYVSRDRRKIRAIDFSNETQAWSSTDPTWLDEDVTRGLVREALYARDPNSAIVLVLYDGTIACCTYDRAQKVAAWWRADLGAPVLGGAVVDGPDGSVLYLLVQRTGGVLLEAATFAELVALRPYCHAAVVAEVAEADPVVVEGLDHLEGETVVAVLDGVVQAGLVVEDGAVTLEGTGLQAVVGLPFVSTATTLPPEGGNPAGSAQGAKRRRPQVVLRLHESALPKVNGKRAPERTSETALDAAAPLVAGDVATWHVGWNDGVVTLVQDLPLRTEVLAIFGLEQVNQL